MRKIDVYILKKLLTTFFFCMLLFTVVAVAVDTSEKSDNFMKTGMTTMEIIKNYHLGFVPWIWSMLFPLFVFIAVIFFTSKMALRSEIIAILASGTSYNRFLRPYFVGGVLLALLLWAGTRWWIPKANIIRSSFQTRFVDANDPSKNPAYGGCYHCFYLRIDSNTFIGVRDYDTVSKSGRHFFMERIRDDKMIYNLRAETIKWDTAIKKWQLQNVAERVIDSFAEQLTFHASYTISLALKPDELRKDFYLKDKLTTSELSAFIRREEARGTEGLNVFRVELYRRTATAFAVVLLTMIGVLIAGRKTRGGSGMHLALGIVIAATFIVSDRFSTIFATKGNFHPLLAAWLPNIVFSVVAIWLYRRTPK